jgi:hypothetical protein
LPPEKAFFALQLSCVAGEAVGSVVFKVASLEKVAQNSEAVRSGVSGYSTIRKIPM